MKSILTKLLITFFVGIIYLLGWYYGFKILPWLGEIYEGIYSDLSIIIQLIVLIIIPLLAAVSLSRRGKPNLAMALAAFANILSFHILIQSMVFISSPFICFDPTFDTHFIISHLGFFIVGIVSMFVLSNIARQYRTWILLSFLLMFLFNAIVFQAWYLIILDDEQIHNSLYTSFNILLDYKSVLS